MLNKSLAVGIVFLFIVSSTIPMVLGNDIESEVQTQSTALSGGPMDSAWPTYSHDNRHTGQSPYNTRDNPMNIQWKFEANYLGFQSSPVIDQDGILYIGARDHYLYALNPDGSQRWRCNIGDWASDSAALAADGTIYIGSMDDCLYAVNPDGSLKWRFHAEDSIFGAPTIAMDGTIYFGITGPGYYTGWVYAVNPDGTEKWHTDVGDYVYCTPALAKDGTMYITSNDRYLYALHPEDGSVLWKYRTSAGLGEPSIGNDGTIYVPSHDDYLYAINPDGTLRWKIEIGTGSSDTPAIGNDGTIYIGELYFYAINPDGTIKWTYEGWEHWEYEVTSSAYAISADDLIYFVATKGSGHGGDLFALNCDDGSLFWRKNIAPNCYQLAQPVIGGDGTVYIGSEFVGDSTDGYLYAFGTVEDNHPPDKPDIDGPITGKVGVEQEYTFTVIDEDSDDIYIFVDWGDNANSGWLGPYASGEQITLNHSWNQQGTYSLQAKAKDEHDIEGEWATQNVIMPKNKIINPFERFLENHPYMFPLLRKILTR